MTQSNQAQFSCSACGRTYAWKPQLAGRQAKCKCGQMIAVPAEPPQPDLADIPFANPEPAPAPQPSAAPSAAQARCPSCGGALAPGAVICVQCGYNLKTRSKLSTSRGRAAAAAPAASAASPAPTIYAGQSIRRSRAPEETGGSTKLYIVLGVIVLIVAAVVGGRIIYQQSGGSTPTALKLGDDGKIEKWTRGEGAFEAREWLRNAPQRMAGNMTRDKALGLADRIYGMGAKKILAFGTGIIAREWAIELPDDPAQRKAIFQWECDRRSGSDSTATLVPDVGQKYLVLSLSLF